MADWHRNGVMRHSLKLGGGLLWAHILNEEDKKIASIGTGGLVQIQQEFTSLSVAKKQTEVQVELFLEQMLRELRSSSNCFRLLWLCLWLWTGIGISAILLLEV